VDYLDFLAAAAVDGRVLDLAKDVTPQQVEASLGADFIDDMGKRHRYFRRDYGLIEFAFARNVEWVCTNAIIQVHRLTRQVSVPVALIERYGQFPSRIGLADFTNRVETSGHRLVMASRAFDKPCERYTLRPATEVEVFAMGKTEARDGAWPQPGELWSLSVW
jgi:hypothetical protein